MPAAVMLHPDLPHGKPLLQHLELLRRILQGSRARGLFLMPIPRAFAVARGFSRVAIRARLRRELWPGVCGPLTRSLQDLGHPLGQEREEEGLVQWGSRRAERQEQATTGHSPKLLSGQAFGSHYRCLCFVGWDRAPVGTQHRLQGTACR